MKAGERWRKRRDKKKKCYCGSRGKGRREMRKETRSLTNEQRLAAVVSSGANERSLKSEESFVCQDPRGIALARHSTVQAIILLISFVISTLTEPIVH